MRILETRIGAYRSLFDVSLAPAALTVLVGPNNSGKSNIVDSLDFLGEVYRHGVELAISRRGGYENIAYRSIRRTKRPITFTIEAEADPRSFLAPFRPRGRATRGDERVAAPVRIRHSFAIKAASEAITADFSVIDETVTVWQQHEPVTEPIFSVTRSRGNTEIAIRPDYKGSDLLDADVAYPLNNDSFRAFLTKEAVAPTALLVASLEFNPAIRYFSQTIGQTRLYQLTAIECRHPGVPTPNAELERHGNNLPAFVRYMQTQHSRPWRSVLNSMRRVVPKLDDILTTYTNDRRLALLFKEQDLPRPWTADEVSDGTVQSLALFAALFDPRAPFALIEEPENSVHPWILRNFVDACRQAQGKQIMVTTHSPALLSYLDATEVSVVWKDAGATHVRPLTDFRTPAGKTIQNGYATVYDLLDSGLLKEAVPAQS